MQIQKEIQQNTQAVIQELKKGKCNFCGKIEVLNSIIDSETLREVFLCENCYNKVTGDLTAEQEDYILESGLEMMREEREQNRA